MNHLTNELIEQYENRQLSNEDAILVQTHRHECPDCEEKLNAIDLLGARISALPLPSLHENFNLTVMKKIYAYNLRAMQQKRVFLSVIGIFSGMTLIILAFMAGLALQHPSNNQTMISVTEYLRNINRFTSIFQSITKDFISYESGIGILLSALLVGIVIIVERIRVFKSKMVLH